MAGEFGQFKPAERRLSDIKSVQTPVQDASSASAMGSLAQGVAALGQVGITAFQVSEQQKQQQLQEEQQQAFLEQKQSFETELLRAKDMADQQGSTSLGFKTFLTMAFDESPLDFETKTKMMKDFQATVLGKSFTEVSPEERAFAKMTEEAGAAGYFTQDSSPDEIEAATAQYAADQRQAEADAAALRQINLQQAALNLTQDQRTELEREQAKKQYGALANLAANGRTPTKNAINNIVSDMQKGAITTKDAQDLLTAKKGELEAVIAQMTRNVKDKGSVEALAKPLLDLYDYAIGNADSKDILQELKTQNDIMIEKVKFNQLSNDPDLVGLVSYSNLFGNNNPALFQAMTPKAAELINRNSSDSDKPADVAEGTSDTGVYLDTMSDAIDNIGVLNPDGSQMIDQQRLLVNINNTILGANRYIDAEDAPTQNKQLIQWLAQPKVGKYVGENFGQLTPAARVKLADTLEKNAVNYVYPRVNELTSALFVEEKKPRTGTSKVRKVSGVTEDEVEMIEQGGSVIFRGSSPDSQRVADTMNREVAGALTTYFNAIANMSTDNFSTVFEREKQIAWPSKYGEPTEDGTYVDEATGEEFEVRDGKRVE